jgi:hypothetical protein
VKEGERPGEFYSQSMKERAVGIVCHSLWSQL